MRAKLTYCTDLSLREQTIKQKSQHVYKRTQFLVEDSMARAKSPCALKPLPLWPSLEELGKATVPQLGHLGTHINEKWNPVQPITAGSKSEMALAIVAFYEKDPVAKQDGLRDATKYKPDEPAPWQKDKESAAASSIEASAAVGSAAVLPQPDFCAFASACIQSAQAATPDILQRVNDLLNTCAWYLGAFFLVAWFVPAVIYLFVSWVTTPKVYDVKNMTNFEKWELARAGVHSHTQASSDIFTFIAWTIKTGYMLYSRLFTSTAFPVLAAKWWHNDSLFSFWAWVEFFLLCFVASWPNHFVKDLVVFLIKFLFVKEVKSYRVAMEIAFYYILNWANSNKTVKELWQSVIMFCKSLQAKKETLIFLLQEPFLEPYNDTMHPFHPDYLDAGGKKPDYSRPHVNELLGMLGQETGAGRVFEEDKKKLWKAHETNTTRKSLCWLFKTVIKHKS